MELKSAFCLAAGKGSRMGEIGKVLPKVAWPLFESNLLELQTLFLQELSFKDITVNTHYLSEKVKDILHDNTKILHEDNLLGSGGAIHNFKKHNEIIKCVLTINSDQFIFSNELKEKIEKESKSISKESIILFANKVSRGSGYNMLCTNENNRLIEIKTNNFPNEYYTYTGIGLINLEKLKYVEGASSFFETVAMPNGLDTKVVEINEYDIWDFGTKDLFVKNARKVLANKTNPMYKFLKRNNKIKDEKISGNSYYSSGEGVLNFSSRFIEGENSIILDCNDGEKEIQYKNVLAYKSTMERLD